MASDRSTSSVTASSPQPKNTESKKCSTLKARIGFWHNAKLIVAGCVDTPPFGFDPLPALGRRSPGRCRAPWRWPYGPGAEGDRRFCPRPGREAEVTRVATKPE